MKVIKILFSMIIAFTIMNGEKVNAYEFEENVPYIIMDCETIGTVKVYIPKDKVEFLQITKERDNVINISSGTVYGYCHVGTTEYRINFNTFTQNTYRLNTSAYNNENLNINMIIETNISHMKEQSEMSFEEILLSKGAMTELLIIMVIMLLGLLWLKH